MASGVSDVVNAPPHLAFQGWPCLECDSFYDRQPNRTVGVSGRNSTPSDEGELLGYDLVERTGYGLVLTACLPGTSATPPDPDREQLRALGAAAAGSARPSSIRSLRSRSGAGRSRARTSPPCAATRAHRTARAAEAAAARPGGGRPWPCARRPVARQHAVGRRQADRGARLGLRRRRPGVESGRAQDLVFDGCHPPEAPLAAAAASARMLRCARHSALRRFEGCTCASAIRCSSSSVSR